METRPLRSNLDPFWDFIIRLWRNIVDPFYRGWKPLPQIGLPVLQNFSKIIWDVWWERLPAAILYSVSISGNLFKYSASIGERLNFKQASSIMLRYFRSGWYWRSSEIHLTALLKFSPFGWTVAILDTLRGNSLFIILVFSDEIPWPPQTHGPLWEASLR